MSYSVSNHAVNAQSSSSASYQEREERRQWGRPQFRQSQQQLVAEIPSSVFRRQKLNLPPSSLAQSLPTRADNYDQFPPFKQATQLLQGQPKPPSAQLQQPSAQARQSPVRSTPAGMDADPHMVDEDGEDTVMQSQDVTEVHAQHSKIARLQILLDTTDPQESDIIDNVRNQIQQLKKLITQTTSPSVQLKSLTAAMTRRQDHILRWQMRIAQLQANVAKSEKEASRHACPKRVSDQSHRGGRGKSLIKPGSTVGHPLGEAGATECNSRRDKCTVVRSPLCFTGISFRSSSVPEAVRKGPAADAPPTPSPAKDPLWIDSGRKFSHVS